MRLITSRPYHSIRDLMREVASHFPVGIERTARRAKDAARDLMGGNSVFSQLGFTHIGPIDGHDMDHLLPVLKNLRDSSSHGPVLVHVVTEKGHGHPFASPSKKNTMRFLNLILLLVRSRNRVAMCRTTHQCC